MTARADLDALIAAPPPSATLAWAVGAAAADRVLLVRPLPGGSSHANHLLRLEVDGGPVDVALRRWVRPDWRETDPAFSPEQEAATYELLASTLVPAPALIAADPAGASTDVPAILLTMAPGRPSLRPRDPRTFLRELAAPLPVLHRVDRARAKAALPPYRPYAELSDLRVPAWTRRPAAWRRALEIVSRQPPAEPSAFIHRDYHPGNTLWIDGRLSAIVDWTNASWGPPAVDLAHMRANLAMSQSQDLADGFLRAHAAVAGTDQFDPYWDLRVAVDFLPDLDPRRFGPETLRRLDEFVARAVAER